MEPHPYFNLRLHSDVELSAILGSPLILRQTLHEWPLACVQELRLADGRHMVYKTQWGPSVEARFYRQARSTLLVPARSIYRAGLHSVLLQDFIEAPSLNALRLPKDELMRVGQALSGQVAAVTGRKALYLNLSTPERWLALVDTLAVSIGWLIAQGQFIQVTGGDVDAILRAGRGEKVLAVFNQAPVLLHGDLSGDNLFVLPDGFKVIDWQRPLLGPSGLDLVNLLESQGFTPVGVLDEGLVAVHNVLRMAWFAACATRWFKPGIETYDAQIAGLARALSEGGLV